MPFISSVKSESTNTNKTTQDIVNVLRGEFPELGGEALRTWSGSKPVIPLLDHPEPTEAGHVPNQHLGPTLSTLFTNTKVEAVRKQFQFISQSES